MYPKRSCKRKYEEDDIMDEELDEELKLCLKIIAIICSSTHGLFIYELLFNKIIPHLEDYENRCIEQDKKESLQNHMQDVLSRPNFKIQHLLKLLKYNYHKYTQEWFNISPNSLYAIFLALINNDDYDESIWNIIYRCSYIIERFKNEPLLKEGTVNYERYIRTLDIANKWERSDELKELIKRWNVTSYNKDMVWLFFPMCPLQTKSCCHLYEKFKRIVRTKKINFIEEGHPLFKKFNEEHKGFKSKDININGWLDGLILDQAINHGGRTCYVRSDDRVLRYKFLRVGEDPLSFIQEEFMNIFCNAHRDELGLKSELPIPIGVSKIQEEDIPYLIRYGFKDKIQYYDDDDSIKSSYTFVYCSVTKDMKYNIYAHCSPPHLIENNILRAFHDIVVCCNKLGVFFTSIIPAYHDTYSERFWTLLLGICNDDALCDNYPGTFGAWRKVIKECDLRESGFADWGDFETWIEWLKKIPSYLKFKDAKIDDASKSYQRRVAALNCIAENLLACLLVYVECYRKDDDYHYKNEVMLKRMGLFIEALFNQLLDGFKRNYNLNDLFDSEDQKDMMLYKTAQEIIYWTANQEKNNDCYVTHIRNGLDDNYNVDGTHEIYLLNSLSDFGSSSCRSLTNIGYVNRNNDLNLGAANSLFPLIFFVKLTIFVLGHVISN